MRSDALIIRITSSAFVHRMVRNGFIHVASRGEDQFRRASTEPPSLAIASSI